MDHKLAETQQSVERYMLNELSPEERAEFEDHMFDCPSCSERVRQDFTVMENLKEVLREEPVAQRAGWLEWLRVPSLVPTFAALALACVVGYQNFGGAGEMAVVLPQVAVLKATSRGDNASVAVQVGSKAASFELAVPIDSAGPFECEFQNAAGAKVMTLKSGSENPDLDLTFQLPTKRFPAGRYQLILHSASNPADSIAYTFEVHYSA
jgi:anti-sigma factor RsiW